ncbi:protein FAM53A [Moschus berezovskii]|uniref:protein FAM53A n=1 Tax=Moschus berezovskii TaxID=68408 RepID=UPI0024439667|nr:protein FAM53A [Moschus berezovskii]
MGTPHPCLRVSAEEEHSLEVVGGGRLVGSQVAVGPTSPSPPGPRSHSVDAFSAQDLRGSAGPPSVPPSKRHGGSLLEPEELARGGSPRRPGGPRIWTPATKRL